MKSSHDGVPSRGGLEGTSSRARASDSVVGSLLSYETVKVVRVHDKRLSVLHYTFMLVIFAYIVGYVIVWQQRYLLTGVPTGSIRMTLKAPKLRTNASLLPYCWSEDRQKMSPPDSFLNFNCTYWDENFVLFPSVEDHDMFVTTRVNITNQHLDNCTMDDYQCTYVNDVPPDTYFIPDIENFTMMLDHTVYVPGILEAMSAMELTGGILDKNGNKMTLPQTPLNHIGLSGQPDLIPISVLLQAAGVNLDAQAETENQNGIILLVFLDYSNMITYNPNTIEYWYRVSLVDGAKFSVTQPVYTKTLDKRQIWTRHGIRIIVIHTGSVGKFDFQTLLLSLVGGLGLMTVATVLVDNLATKILPAKVVYNKYKYEDTTDIRHDLLDAEESASEKRSFDTLPAEESERESERRKLTKKSRRGNLPADANTFGALVEDPEEQRRTYDTFQALTGGKAQ